MKHRPLPLSAPLALALASVASLASAGAANAAAPAGGPPARPNIIVILADDLGYGELGSYGQQVIRTPRLDQMAREGLRFTQFYAGATVCAPSRSVLMTGLHHGHTRVRGNAGPGNMAAQSLQPGDLTVAALLRRAGYRTGLVGKWGLGDIGAGESGLPGRQGFDEFFGYLNQRHAHNHFPDFLWRNEERIRLPNQIVPDGDTGAGYAREAVLFADDLLADEALKFVSRHQAQPFFLYWSMVIPHANNELMRAKGSGFQVPDFGPYAGEAWPEQDKGQAALVTRMDGYVGRMLDHLRLLGLERNTLVIFTSDNGPHNEAGHDLARFKPAGPYSGIKRSLTDGGIRVPCIAWWPGSIGAGQVSGHVGYFGDLLATAAELAGVPAPAGLDSLSLVPTLTGRIQDQRSHDYLYWEFHEGGFRQAALHQGRWKAIRAGAPDAPVRLHDLRSDPAEKRDVAAEFPEMAERLSSFLRHARTPAPTWEPVWSPPAPR